MNGIDLQASEHCSIRDCSHVENRALDNLTHNIDGRWFVAGLFTTTLLAVADIGKTWYWFPDVIPVPVPVYALSIWFVYASCVLIGIFIGWYRKAVATRIENKTWVYAVHGASSVAIAATHLLMNSFIVWVMFATTRPLDSFLTLYLEKLVAWLPYEVLAYGVCLAVFSFLELQKNRGVQSGETQPEYQTHFVAKKGYASVIVKSNEVAWIEALDNYVVLGTSTDRYILHDSMARLESVLDPGLFHRIHRSVIVNLSRIGALEQGKSKGLQVRMKGGAEFTVSRRRRSSVRRIILGRKKSQPDGLVDSHDGGRNQNSITRTNCRNARGK